MSAREAFGGGVAVITGAGSGIGEGLSRYAASIGMKVVLADIAVDRIEEVAADIRASGGEALTVPTDVTDSKSLEGLAEAAYGAYGDVRLLINNAGIETIGYIWEVSAEVWDRLLAVNVSGVINGVRIFAPRMLAGGKPCYIANLSSVGGLAMFPTHAPYLVSKHAVLSFTECLYLEMQLLGKPVHVSAVLPGPVKTRIFEDALSDPASDWVERHRAAMREMIEKEGIEPEEAGRLILEGIAARQFWVSTHPHITARMAKARSEYLAGLRMPGLTEETRAILES